MDWKQQYRLFRLLLAVVVVVMQGVVCQQQQQKPQIYWASDGNQKGQQLQRVPITTWSQSYNNHLDRDWNSAPSAPAPQPYYPQPATPSAYAPPPVYTIPASYVPPPVYNSPAPPPPPPPVYTSPAPPPPTTQAPSSYNAPLSAGNPAPPPVPSPAPPGPPTPPINYYYYWPDKPQKGVQLPKPSEVFEPEKELFPNKPWLVEGQKVWIAVLTPLIVVALVVPLVAILFSGMWIIILLYPIK